MITFPRMEPGRYYHVFNRGNNRENLFREERNFAYFLDRMRYHLLPVLNLLAYSLLGNHYHFAVRVKTWDEQKAWAERNRHTLLHRVELKPLDPSQQISNLFNGYAKAVNRMYGRVGSLFQKRFRRIELESGNAIRGVVTYVHHNPEKHGFVPDFRAYAYSSYREILQGRSVLVDTAATTAWFGGIRGFVAAHDGLQKPGDDPTLS